MAGSYRRYYIGTGATLLSIFLALQMYGLQIEDVSGDITCGNECVSYFNVKNPTYRSIYIYNKESVAIDFSPEIEDYKLYVKYYGKWRHMNFTLESRLPNVPKDRIYVFVFPRYSTKEFKLVGTKEASETIKWGFGFEEDYLDPVWIGVEPTDCIWKNVIIGTEREEIWEWKEYEHTCAEDEIIVDDNPEGLCQLWNVSHYSTKFKENYTHIDLNDKLIEYEKYEFIKQITVNKTKMECLKTCYINESGTQWTYKNMCTDIRKLKGVDRFVGVSFKDGGQYNKCKPDCSVDCIITDENGTIIKNCPEKTVYNKVYK